jgi:hydroxymethylpyrimidine/phosphomethylpyrimidine kinase
VAEQIDAVMEDIGIDAAKTGMLGSAGIVYSVTERVLRHAIQPLVVDPVMVAKSGARLLAPEAEAMLRERLLPLALVVTPNLAEAAVLAGCEVTALEEMHEAARRIAGMGPQWVLVKGGHLGGDPVDLLFNGAEFIELARPRVEGANTHGTGCTYASAIATFLGHGLSVPEAVEKARDAVQVALEHPLAFGRGHGPFDHSAMFGLAAPGSETAH